MAKLALKMYMPDHMIFMKATMMTPSRKKIIIKSMISFSGWGSFTRRKDRGIERIGIKPKKIHW